MLRERRRPRRRRLYSGSLAKPNANDYGVILAVNLIGGGFAYGVVFWGSVLSIYAVSYAVAHPAWRTLGGFLVGGFGVLFASLLYSAVLAGGVALLCLIVIPLFDLTAARLALRGEKRRPGMVIGAGVGALSVSPFWGAVWSSPSVWSLFTLCLGTLPLLVALQAAGALAAPGDLLAMRRWPLRFDIRWLLTVTTLAAILAALAGSGSQLLVGLSLLLAFAMATHLVTREPVWRGLRWFLQRRISRRRRARLAGAPNRRAPA